MSALNFRLGLVLLLLCRCSMEPQARANPAPPRLAARSYVAEDGSAFPDPAPYDTKLETACSFLPAQGGQLRCLPQGGAQLLYADQTCSGAPFAARAKSCANKPRFALLPLFSQACALGPMLTRWAPYYVGASIAAPLAAWTADQGSCTEVNAEAYDFFLAIPADPVDFVAASLK